MILSWRFYLCHVNPLLPIVVHHWHKNDLKFALILFPPTMFNLREFIPSAQSFMVNHCRSSGVLQTPSLANSVSTADFAPQSELFTVLLLPRYANLQHMSAA